MLWSNVNRKREMHGQEAMSIDTQSKRNGEDREVDG